MSLELYTRGGLVLLRIEKSHVDEMVAHSREEDPNECCGFLAGVSDTARKSYRIIYVPPAALKCLADIRVGWKRLATRMRMINHQSVPIVALPIPARIDVSETSASASESVSTAMPM